MYVYLDVSISKASGYVLDALVYAGVHFDLFLMAWWAIDFMPLSRFGLILVDGSDFGCP